MTNASLESEITRPFASTARPSALPLRWVATLALLCLAAYWVAGAFTVTLTSASLVRSVAENTYPESPNIYEAIRTARTGRLYFSFSDPPYVFQPYGPLNYAINAGIAKAAQLDVDVMAVRARALALICFILCGCLTFLIAMKLDFSAVESICAAAMLMAQPSFLYWDVTVRPDMLVLLAMLASLFVAVSAPLNRGALNETFRYAMAGVLGGLAFLVKQPGLAAPLVIGGVLLFRGRFRQAVAVAVGAAAPVILTFGALLWRHEPFLPHMTMVGKTPVSLFNGIEFTMHNSSFASLLVALAIGAAGFAIAVRGGEGSQVVASFAAVSWLVGFSSIARAGGDYNYYLPGLAGCALLLPFVIRAFRENVRSAAVYAGVSVVLLIFLPGQISAAGEAIRMERARAASSELAAGGSVYAGLRSLHILSDRPAFALHGRDPDFLDPFSTHELELGGGWDSAPIIENLRRGDYDLVILACNGSSRIICSWRGVSYFNAQVVDELNAHYVVMCSNLLASVLMPRDREVAATPAVLGTVLGAPCGTARRGQVPSLALDPSAR